MDFGARPAFDGPGAPIPEAMLNLAWFERSSAGESLAGEVKLLDGGVGGGLLDRVREAEGLVYNGEGDYEN